MQPHVGLSLHTDGLEPETSKKELDEIPDTAFTEWGSVGASLANKKSTNKEEDKKDEEMKDATKEDTANGEPPKKKQKTEEDKEDSATRPPYVAAFMPSFPKSLQAGRSIVDLPTTATTPAAEDLPGVRSSLVDLGQPSQYWGSGWDAKVPAGKSQDKGNPVVVAPLGRASNSRVSRILEGSMDAYS